MACDEAVFLALWVCMVEYAHRCYNDESSPIFVYSDQPLTFEDFKCKVFVAFYIISLSSTFLYVEGLKSPTVPAFLKSLVPLFYLFDSVAAVGLGYSLYKENELGVIVSMIILMNCFLLHILHSIFNAKKAESLVS
jgi:hypothetical protein